MKVLDILDAVNARLVEKWPDRTVYVDVCPLTLPGPLSGSQSRKTIGLTPTVKEEPVKDFSLVTEILGAPRRKTVIERSIQWDFLNFLFPCGRPPKR